MGIAHSAGAQCTPLRYEGHLRALREAPLRGGCIAVGLRNFSRGVGTPTPTVCIRVGRGLARAVKFVQILRAGVDPPLHGMRFVPHPVRRVAKNKKSRRRLKFRLRLYVFHGLVKNHLQEKFTIHISGSRYMPPSNFQALFQMQRPLRCADSPSDRLQTNCGRHPQRPRAVPKRYNRPK